MTDIQEGGEEAFNVAVYLVNSKEMLEEQYKCKVLIVNIPEIYAVKNCDKYKNCNGMIRKITKKEDIVDAGIWIGENMISHYHFYDDKKEKNLNYSGLKK